MQTQRTLIAGHRGARGLAPENTIEAFEKAIELGADMVEFDVRRTADGTLVIHHDEDISGTLLQDLSCKQLLELKDVRVPTLEEVLRLCAGRIAVDIELKETGCEEAVLKLVSEHANTDEVIITSFIDSVVARIKEIDSSVRTGLLVGPNLPNPLCAILFGPFPLRRCAKVGADVVVPHFSLLRFGFLQRARKRGYPVYVWTVNDEAKMERLIKAGVAAIITDFPDKALEIRSSVVK